MAEDAVPSFESFAKSKGIKARGPCAVCRLPVDIRQQIEQAWAAGFRETAIFQYLASIKQDLGPGTLSYHFRSIKHGTGE